MSAQPQYKAKLVFGALVAGNEVHISATDAKGTTPVTTASGVGATGNHYIAIPCEDSETISIFLGWTGTTNAGTCTVDATNIGNELVKLTDETADWVTDAAVTVGGPDGLGANSEMINISGAGARRYRLFVPITANGEIYVWVWAKD